MPEPDYTTRVGSHGATITGVAEDEDGNPVAINGCTVRFRMAAIDGGDTVTDAAGVVDDTGTEETRGQMHYAFADADIDTPGLFVAYWHVTYPDDDVVTYPNSGPVLVRITPEIAGLS